MISEIIIAIISSVATSGIIYIATVFLKFRIPSLLHIILWKKFKGETTLAITEIINQQDSHKQVMDRKLSVVPFCEAIALKELDKYLNYNYNMKLNPVSIQDRKELSYYVDKDLIILGGPRNNYTSRKILEKIDQKLVYQFSRIRNEDDEIKDDIKFKRLVGEGKDDLVCSTPEEEDYGVIIFCKNPYNSEKHILLLGGLSQCSTLATAIWIQKIPSIKILKYLIKYDGFEIVIRCKSTSNKNVTNIELQGIYELLKGIKIQ